MTPMNENANVPPNIEYFAKGLRRIGVQAYRARVSTPNLGPRHPLPDEVIYERLV
jgi:hypothetical protein